MGILVHLLPPSKEVVVRADAAFAKPEIHEALEQRGVNYAIRIPANQNLERDLAEFLPRPTVDQGREAGGKDDPAELPSLPGQRSAPTSESLRDGKLKKLARAEALACILIRYGKPKRKFRCTHVLIE